MKGFNKKFWLVILCGVCMTSTVVDSSIDGKILAMQAVLNRVQHARLVGQTLNDAQNASGSSSNYSSSIEIMRNLDSGLKNSNEMDTEIQTLLRDTKTVQWEELAIQRPLQLTMVVFRHKNTDNGLQILSFHSLASTGLREDLVTFYNQKIDLADEQNIRESVLVSRRIHVDNSKPVFAQNEIEQYNYSLRTNEFSNAFGLRDPEGAPYFAREGQNNYVTDAQVVTHLSPLGHVIVESTRASTSTTGQNTFYFVYEDRDFTVTASR